MHTGFSIGDLANERLTGMARAPAFRRVPYVTTAPALAHDARSQHTCSVDEISWAPLQPKCIWRSILGVIERINQPRHIFGSFHRRMHQAVAVTFFK